jgi:hypothetical protein
MSGGAAEFISHITDLQRQVSALQSAISRMVRPGTVAQVDGKKGYRVKIGTDENGNEFLSPWIKHPERGKTSVPLKIGQNVGLISPFGDLRQAFLLPTGYSQKAESPNEDMEANVFQDAGVKVSVKDGVLMIETGGTAFAFSGSGFEQTGGTQKHDGHDVGKTHKHKLVKSGDDTSGEPE